MSNETGDKAAMAGPLGDSKALVEAAAAAVEVQDDLFATFSAEDMLEAREALGDDASKLDVLREARRRRAGRPRGARNKRTDDFARYILSFGQDPAITLMQIASTQPELLIEASRQKKVHSFRADGTPNVVIERMTYEQAQSLRARCADILMPFIHGKKPIAVDFSFAGIADMFIEGVTHSREEMNDVIDAEFMEVDDLGQPE